MTDHALSFGSPVADDVRQLSDADFLRALCWNREAPRSQKQAAEQGDVQAFTAALARRCGTLRRSVSAKRLEKHLAAVPAIWETSIDGDAARTVPLVDLCRSLSGGKSTLASRTKLKKKQRKTDPTANGHTNGQPKPASEDGPARELHDWLAGVETDHTLQPIELLALLELLPIVATTIPASALWSLWRTVMTAALETAGSLDELAGVENTAEGIASLTGELPFVAGLLFAGLKGAGRLQRQGIKQLAKQLLDSTDTDGTLNAELIPRLPIWLTVFVRAKQWANAFRESFWNDEAKERFSDMIGVAAALCRPDGRLALSNGLATPALPILSAAAATSGLESKSRPRRLLEALSKRKRPAASKAKTAARTRAVDRPGSQSDWAKLAWLRTDWSADADLLAVAHDGELPRIDFSVAGANILGGEWDLEVTLNGEPISTRGDWESTCWFSDRDVDFIELQHNAGDGVLIDRQIVLARKLQFAILTDCISGGGEYPVNYRSRLPLSDGAKISRDTDTRAVQLAVGKTAVRCYPLALPCDRVDSTPGTFTATDNGLTYTQTATGGLVAPLLLDWSPERRKLDVEWRKLTVAEQGRGLGTGEAGAYRLRVGPLHLLVFRKLKHTTESQTVLGMHTRHETVVGRFTKDGNISEMLMVE